VKGERAFLRRCMSTGRRRHLRKDEGNSVLVRQFPGFIRDLLGLLRVPDLQEENRRICHETAGLGSVISVPVQVAVQTRGLQHERGAVVPVGGIRECERFAQERESAFLAVTAHGGPFLSAQLVVEPCRALAQRCPRDRMRPSVEAEDQACGHGKVSAQLGGGPALFLSAGRFLLGVLSSVHLFIPFQRIIFERSRKYGSCQACYAYPKRNV
jgi:hypothetical protein